jgi:hypothetical protein
MKKEENFRNFINYPVNKPIIPIKPVSRPVFPKRADHNCCGFVSATGDTITDPNAPAVTVPVTVSNVTTLNYIKTGFAIVGVFVIGKYLYMKFIK